MGTEGVSEVLGHMLVFGIISIILVLSMVTFHERQDDARVRIERLRAESAAARVSGLLVQAGLIAERLGTESEVRFPVELPYDFGGRSYTVALLSASGSDPAQVRVQVPSDGITADATLFAADAPAGYSICPTTVGGGPLHVRFGDDPAGSGVRCLFIESAA
jgi:hypothetical protein